MYRVALVSADHALVRIVRAALRRGCDARVVRRPPDLPPLTPTDDAPDLVIFDWRHAADRERCALATAWATTPRLAIVSREGLADVSTSSELDDFVVAPLRPLELVQRVVRLLDHASSSADHALAVGALRLDPVQHTVLVEGQPVNLTAKEYGLLAVLMQHADTTLTRGMLLRRVWERDSSSGQRTVDVHVRRLRLKLGVKCRPCIETVRTVGYRFVATPGAGP